MSVSLPLTGTARAEAAASSVEIPQLRIRGIFAVWAAAALPMAMLAWLVAPVLADRARCYELLGRLPECLTDLEAAYEADPAVRDSLKPKIVKIRKALGKN